MSGLFLALGACGGGGSGSTTPGGGPPAESVRLARDEFGVAHVFAETDEGALYGLGWASAEDRFLQMSWHKWIGEGRLAELLGSDPQYVASDVDARAWGYKRYADRAFAALDDESSRWLSAYARGVNAYLQGGGAVHPLFAERDLPIEPWEPSDCILLWMRMARFFAPSPLAEATAWQDFEELVADVGFDEALARSQVAQIYDDDAAAVAFEDVPNETLDEMCAYTSQLVADGGVTDVLCSGQGARHMSHAWAVSGDRSQTGSALLSSDPKAGVVSPAVFYEWHIQGDTINVRGVGPVGTLQALVGSNERIAWGATSVGADQADLFRVEVDPSAHPGQYRLDGVWRDYETDEEETILVQGGSPVTFRYRETYFGPLVTDLLPDGVAQAAALANLEFAVRAIPLSEPERDTVQSLPDLFRAASVTDFLAGMERWRYPAINLVAADATGSIAYTLGGALPVRSVVSPLAGGIAQDGAQSAADWVDIIPADLLPRVVDPAAGHVFSANHMPVGSWYPLPLRIATGGAGDTSRSRRLRERLEAQPLLSQADMQDVHLDTVNVARRDIARLGLHLRDVQGGLTDAQALAALDHLDGWVAAGASMAPLHYGVALAHHFDVKFRQLTAGPLINTYGSGENGLQYFLKTATERVDSGGALTAEEVIYVTARLADAYALTIANAGGNPQSQWLTWYEREQSLSIVPWIDLEGFPSLDPSPTLLEVGPLTCRDEGTLLSQNNQSFSQSLTLGQPDLTRTVLPVGNAERGVHQGDQRTLFEQRQFKAEPLDEGALEALGFSADVTLEFQP